MMSKLYIWLFGLFNFSAWTRGYAYDKALDEWFIECLEDGFYFTHIGTLTARMKGVEVWIGNYPYACFKIGEHSGLPSRYTVYRLQKRLMESEVIQAKAKAKSNNKLY